jgi:hypothetical protein
MATTQSSSPSDSTQFRARIKPAPAQTTSLVERGTLSCGRWNELRKAAGPCFTF